MKKSVSLISAIIATVFASPAFADDAAIDVDSMVEEVSPKTYDAITPAIGSFDIGSLNGSRNIDFMATMTGHATPEYRLKLITQNFEADSSAGLAALIVPEEFAFRSNAQDTGVDAALPGRFLSSSTRSDFLSPSGPANRDKSSLGIRLGF